MRVIDTQHGPQSIYRCRTDFDMRGIEKVLKEFRMEVITQTSHPSILMLNAQFPQTEA